MDAARRRLKKHAAKKRQEKQERRAKNGPIGPAEKARRAKLAQAKANRAGFGSKSRSVCDHLNEVVFGGHVDTAVEARDKRIKEAAKAGKGNNAKFAYASSQKFGGGGQTLGSTSAPSVKRNRFGGIMKESKGRSSGGGGGGQQQARNQMHAPTGGGYGAGHQSTALNAMMGKMGGNKPAKFDRRAAGACDLGGNPIRGDQKRAPNAGDRVAAARADASGRSRVASMPGNGNKLGGGGGGGGGKKSKGRKGGGNRAADMRAGRLAFLARLEAKENVAN